MQNFPNADFSGAQFLEITWYGWSDTGSRVGLNLYIKNNGTYYDMGLLHDEANIKQTRTLTLPPHLTNVEEILFRTHESSFTNTYQPDKTMRIHIFSVKLL